MRPASARKLVVGLWQYELELSEIAYGTEFGAICSGIEVLPC
jgi:hypothetical protein